MTIRGIHADQVKRDTGKHVLVVSYDAVFSLDLQEMLNDSGLESVHFMSLGADVDAALTNPGVMAAIFDLDVRDGEVRDVVPRDPLSGLPVIVLTPDLDASQWLKSEENVCFLSKPIVVEHLLPMILPNYPVYPRDLGNGARPA